MEKRLPIVYGFQNLHLKELAERVVLWRLGSSGVPSGRGKINGSQLSSRSRSLPRLAPMSLVLIGFVLRLQTGMLQKNKGKKRTNLCITQKSLNELWAQCCRVLSRLMSRLVLPVVWELPPAGPKFLRGLACEWVSEWVRLCAVDDGCDYDG